MPARDLPFLPAMSKAENPTEGPVDRRRGKQDRRAGKDDRRATPSMRGPRTRFTLTYFLLFLAALFALQLFVADRDVEEIPYSELKQRIAAGEVAEVRIGDQRIEAESTEAVREADGPEGWTAVRVEDEQLVPLLEEQGIPFTGVPTAWWTGLLIWLIPLTIIIIFWLWIIRRMSSGGGAQGGILTVGKSKARIVGQEGTGVDFSDVAGVDEARQETEEIVQFLREPEKFSALGAKIPKGVLLLGPPGTGKTLLARAVAGEAKVTFFQISGAEFVEMFVGVGAARVRDLFKQAKAQAPCIIFIDELDALGKARGSGGMTGGGGNDEREQTLNQLLVEMDGFDPHTGVIIMAATNRPEILDPALLRPGRFDRQILVDRPDVRGRHDILKIHAREVKLEDDVDLEVIARRTPGFVGADIANLLNEAALLAARRDREKVSMQEINDAVDRIVAGLEKKNRLINERERNIVAYHEAGHAIVAERVDNADPVHKISIIPRGVAALGYTQQLPTEDRYLLTKPELMDRIAVLLGGRVAEEIVFDEISTGAGNDLERVSDLARRMVMEYGMSRELGPIRYSATQRSQFLEESGMAGPRQYSEHTAREIDREVHGIVEGTHARVREILEADRDVLEEVAQRLLENEVVEEPELRKIMGLPPRTGGDPEDTVVDPPSIQPEGAEPPTRSKPHGE